MPKLKSLRDAGVLSPYQIKKAKKTQQYSDNMTAISDLQDFGVLSPNDVASKNRKRKW